MQLATKTETFVADVAELIQEANRAQNADDLNEQNSFIFRYWMRTH